MAAPNEKIHQPWTSEKHPASTSALLTSLEALRVDNPKAVRTTVHLYPASIYDSDNNGEGSSRDRRISSWKMTEHLYFSAANQFPTLARGLFTEEVQEDDDVPEEAQKCEGEWAYGIKRQRIVARGYDKFFNVDEVDWTNVSWRLLCLGSDRLVEAHGRPYAGSISSNFKEQWVPHPYLSIDTAARHGRIKTLAWNNYRNPGVNQGRYR